MVDVSRDQKQQDEHAADARADRLAARAARRSALAHAGCTGRTCTHRNHRRDVYHAGWLTEALQLQDVPPPTREDYSEATAYHAYNSAEAEFMR